MSKELDLESMPLEELETLAKVEPVAEKETAEEVTPSEEETVYRREIDLGDGSGKQVFEAPTMEGLVDALAQAQTHATRKIRELARDTKVEKAAGKEPEKELTADEEWLLSQELLNHPSKTQKKLIEAQLGMSVEEAREGLAAIREIRAERLTNAAGDEFVAAHKDDYYPCPANGNKVAAYLKTYGLPQTVENLEQALKDLNESGLLTPRPEAETPSAESVTAEQQESSRIVKPETKPVATTRRVGSGLTSRGRSAAAPIPHQPTEDELYDMPLDKLEALAQKHRE